MRQKALFCEAGDVVFTRGFRIYGGFALPLLGARFLANPHQRRIVILKKTRC